MRSEPDPRTDVLVCGIFDLLHQGHLHLLRRASELGPVVVGLLTDELATSYKRKPVLTWWERRAALQELPWVVQVVRKTSHDTRDLIRQYEPRYLACGTDWEPAAFYELNHLTSDFMERNDVAMVFLPSDRTMTTTRIIERM